MKKSLLIALILGFIICINPAISPEEKGGSKRT